MISKYEVERRLVGEGEVIVDVYQGESAQEHNNLWSCHFEGDMDSETLGTVILQARALPPGTFLKLELPVCPKCGEVPEKTSHAELVDKTEDGDIVWDYIWKCDTDCDMDWRQFAEDNYS